MATIYYWTTKGTPSARPIYGVHPSGRPVSGGVPEGVVGFEVPEAPHAIPWPVPPNATKGREAWTVMDTTAAPSLRVDPALAPIPADGDRFDTERWIKATNLYWLDVVTKLVQGLNQVRVDPLIPYPPASAPTATEVKAGVVAKYRALG